MRPFAALLALCLSITGGQAVDLPATGGADAQAAAPAPEIQLDRLLASRFAADGAGAVVLVARDGRILFEKAYGLADIEQHREMTVDTPLRIGSITKQFTASAILRLQEAGRLSITDRLSAFYPDFPRGGEVTLRHLLTHTSGIHSYTESPRFLQEVTKPTAAADVVASIKRYPYDFSPGAKWSYSNSGYFLLGDIVEKVSGRPYADFLHEAFFGPFGMRDTGVYRNDKPPARAALGYEYRDGQFKKALDWDMTWAGGAGALYSTAGDLYRWNEAVFGGKVLSPDDRAAAFTPVVTEENRNDKSDGGYGYGWRIDRYRGARQISHGGGLNGFLSNLVRFPEQHFTVVVLVNEFPVKPQTDPATLTREIADLYLGGELAPLSTAPQVVSPVSAASLAAIAGRYDYGMAVMVVTVEGDHAYAQLAGQPRFEIFPQSETEFFWKVVDAQVRFVKDASGRVIEAVHHQGGQTIHAPRLEEIPAIRLSSDRISPLLGDYDFKALGKLVVSCDGTTVYAQLTGQPKLEIEATSETEFVYRMVNAKLTFVKGPDGSVAKVVLHQRGQDFEMPRIREP